MGVRPSLVASDQFKSRSIEVCIGSGVGICHDPRININEEKKQLVPEPEALCFCSDVDNETYSYIPTGRRKKINAACQHRQFLFPTYSSGRVTHDARKIPIYRQLSPL